MWIEISETVNTGTEEESQPARAVWIEILRIDVVRWLYLVTACEGCVD